MSRPNSEEVERGTMDEGLETWKDKWAMIESRWETCVAECLQGRIEKVEGGDAVVRLSARKCRGAIEAVAQDVWALRDWLIHDTTSGLDAAKIDDHVHSPNGYHIRACSDLATRVKHFRVDDKRKHLLELRRVDTVKDGMPIVFRAVRIFQHPRDPTGTKRQPTGDRDEYEDAVEMVHRAIKEWRAFLTSEGLLTQGKE